MTRVRRTYYLRQNTARLLDLMSLTSGNEKSEIIDRGVIYTYALRKALPPDLAELVERIADDIAKGLSIENQM